MVDTTQETCDTTQGYEHQVMELVVQRLNNLLTNYYGQDDEEFHNLSSYQDGMSGEWVQVPLFDICNICLGTANGNWGTTFSCANGRSDERDENTHLEDMLNRLPLADVLDDMPDAVAQVMVDWLATTIANILYMMAGNTQRIIGHLTTDERQQLRTGTALSDLIDVVVVDKPAGRIHEVDTKDRVRQLDSLDTDTLDWWTHVCHVTPLPTCADKE